MYSLGKFDLNKIRCEIDAKIESETLKKCSLNLPTSENLLPWLKTQGEDEWRIAMLNIQSLPAHFEDLRNDNMMMSSDIICLVETWLLEEHHDVNINQLAIPAYKLLLGSHGKGKGVALYVKEDIPLHSVESHKNNGIQWLKVSMEKLDLLLIYRPPGGHSPDELIRMMEPHINTSRPCIITG